MEIENKILWYLNAVYSLSEEDKKKIAYFLETIWYEEKNKILILVYRRYEDFVNHAKVLKRNIDISWNLIEELEEKQDLSDLLKTII
jgi:hypothetical protein